MNRYWKLGLDEYMYKKAYSGSVWVYMSRISPEIGQGMLDFVEDCSLGVKSH